MDAVDEVILGEAARVSPRPLKVVTLDDETGALTAAYAGARAYADSLRVERSQRSPSERQRDEELPQRPPREPSQHSPSERQRDEELPQRSPSERQRDEELPHLLAHADLVLARLPKSLAALDEYAGLVARHAAPGVQLVAGGRVKHMSRGMNDVLARHFGQVRASLGVRKARALVASAPRPGPERWPARERHDDVGLTLCAHGACFGGTKVDLGTRLLLGALAERPPSQRRPDGEPAAIDLGCGNGTIAAWFALRGVRVTAIDESRAACASTTATAGANGVADLVDVRRADGLEGLPAGTRELIVCNPPFHTGTAKDSSVALTMIESAARVLRPGGELWLVWNAHLPYLPALRRVGPTQIVARDPRFIVTRTRARP